MKEEGGRSSFRRLRMFRRMAPKQRSRRADEPALNDWPAGNQAIDDDNYRDHQEKVDQPATDVHDEESEHPQDEENYRNRPQHDGILARSE
jgi:hypothetical protein